MRKIYLENANCYTFVDDRDYKNLRKRKWYAKESAAGWYVARCAMVRGVKTTLRMHRVVMRCPKNKEVHHKNGDTLDNRRKNLQVVSKKKHKGYEK